MSMATCVCVLVSCQEHKESVEQNEKEAEEHPVKVAFSPHDSFGKGELINGLPLSSRGLMNLLETNDRSLDEKALKTALEYLKHPQPAESTADPAAEYFNNIIAILLAQKEEVEGLTEGLVSVVNNEQLPLLLRDYALQHYYHAWLRESDLQLRVSLEKGLKRRFQDVHSPLQAVAILSASRLVDRQKSNKGPRGETLKLIGERQTSVGLNEDLPTAFDRQEFVASALETVNNPSAQAIAKVSAMNILIRLGEKDVLVLARKALSDKQTLGSVKSSACAVIGAFGSLKEDQQKLAAIPVMSVRVRAAADIALRRLARDQNKF